MKRILILLMVILTVIAMTSCDAILDMLPIEIPGLTDQGNGEEEEGTEEEEEPDEGEDDVKPLEGFVLIENGKANFRIAYTNDIGSDTISKINKLVTQIRSFGVEIEDPVSAAKAEDVRDCEIIVGGNVKHRGDECSVNPRDLGEKGYTIKTVGQRIVIAGGNKEMTTKAFDLFVRNYLRITDKTKDLDQGIAFSEDINVFVPTTYFIESVKIAGNDAKDYKIFYDLEGMKEEFSTEAIDAFREKLYQNTGIYLDVTDTLGEKNIVFRLVDKVEGDDEGKGFGIYVKDANLYIECAYANAFDEAFGTFAKDKIYDAMKSVIFAEGYKYYDNVSVVYYSKFGAEGNGKVDDFNAIKATHDYANQCGQKVMGDKDKTYYISDDFTAEILVETDVDWNGATFIINDVGDIAFENRSLHLFRWQASYSKIYAAQNLIDTFGEFSVEKGATAIPELAGHIPGTCLIIIWNQNKKDFNRYGANANGGSPRHEVLVINEDGTLNPDTYTVFDYDIVTQINVYSGYDKPLVAENGYFRNICCRTVADTSYKNVYAQYNRGFGLSRSNVTIKNVDHMMLDEPMLDTDSNDPLQKNYGRRNESYPYSGILSFTQAYNCYVFDTVIDGHTTYYEDKTTSSTPVAMGTYDYTLGNSSHIYLKNVTQRDDENTGIADDRYWGIMGSNFSRNLHHENIYINRFDAHAGFWNGSIVDSTIGSHINIIGGGTFLLDGVTRVGNSANFMDMRLDYGSSFDGEIIIKDCVFEAKYGYNTMRGGTYNKNARETAYLIWTAWANPEEEYRTWDFGYTCSLPENIIIDNFKCLAGEYYIFQDIPDVSFDTYQITKSITMKNMERMDVCKSTKCTKLRAIPVTYIPKEQ